MHIHVDGGRFSDNAVRNLVKIFNKQEELIMRALGVSAARWCRGVDQAFLERIERRPPRTPEDLNRAWYGYHNTHPTHYDHTRYHTVNLHNLWYRSTVEFRVFNATLHAGKVKAYIQFLCSCS